MSQSRKRAHATIYDNNNNTDNATNSDTSLVVAIREELDNTELALSHINEKIDSMTNQLKKLSSKKSKRSYVDFFASNAGSTDEINVQDVALRICTFDYFRAFSTTSVLAGTPRNGATQEEIRAAQNRITTLRTLIQEGEKKINELSLALDGLALTSPTPSSSPAFSRRNSN